MGKDTEQGGEAEASDKAKSRRGSGIVAVLVLLTVVGVAIWLIANQDETD